MERKHFDISHLSVLIIDSNQFMRSLLKTALGVLGITKIWEDKDGYSALQQLQHIKPDIILTAWRMDEMDGLVMTGKIRRDSNSVHRFTPIIMISGYGNIEKVFEARDMGVSEYIIKPITAGRVYDHICNIIERPRDFVACPTFNGPCRRRRANSSYGGGEERRKITQVNDGGPAQNDADVLPID